jgi:ferredoxin
LQRCTGCHTCTVDCKSENNTPAGTHYRDVVVLDSGSSPLITRLFVTMACNHCQDPACLTSCPVNAITKEATYGIVVIDQDKCVGLAGEGDRRGAPGRLAGGAQGRAVQLFQVAPRPCHACGALRGDPGGAL